MPRVSDAWFPAYRVVRLATALVVWKPRFFGQHRTRLSNFQCFQRLVLQESLVPVAEQTYSIRRASTRNYLALREPQPCAAKQQLVDPHLLDDFCFAGDG